MNKRLVAALANAAILAACTNDPLAPSSDRSVALAVTPAGNRYYVNAATGNDRNSGSSPSNAWKTLSAVSKEWGRGKFAAGDSIFFTGTFAGGLSLNNRSSGSAAAPIALVGPATIVPGNAERAIEAINTAGIAIRALNVTAAGYKIHTTECVLVYFSTGLSYSTVRLRSMRVAGCGSHAVWFGSYSGSTLTDVLVDSLDLSGSVNGLAAQGDRRGAIQRLTVRNTDSHDNPGRLAYVYGSGNGIQLGQVVDGLVERSRAWNNGAENDNATSGPVGIWTWESTRVVIRYNESFGNKTVKVDGGGFDLDGGSQDCRLEFNYSHNNKGTGYLAFQYAGASAWTGNVIQDNISERDGMGLSEGGSIRLGSGSGSSLGSGWFFGNTVFTDNSGPYRGAALFLRAAPTASIKIHNNIFLATNGARLIRNLSGSAYVLRGNNYWTSGGTFSIAWAGVTYTTLAAFRTATGKESASGTNVDPFLVSPGSGGTLFGRIVGVQPAGYKLLAVSTMRTAGIDLRAAGAPLPATDFFGVAVPSIGPVLTVGASR